MSIKRVVCGREVVMPVYARVEDEGLDFLTYFKRHFRLHIISESGDGSDLVFDAVGFDAPIANALRRTLIAEVPAVAFDAVFFYKNTSIIQDEVLAHRIGLIPLRVDPRLMDFIKPGEDPTDLNTLVFKFRAVGTLPKRDPSDLSELEGDDDVEGKYTRVYTRDLVWDPQGTQAERLPVPAGPVHDDILLAKLAPGQEIEFEAHAIKSVGKDHAKFSPVATAAYRLLPDIRITQDFYDEEADALVARCPMNVYDIEDMGAASSSHSRKAYVARPRDCTVCRECIRDPDWAKRISIERLSDHFIFSVESTGALPARDLVIEAAQILSKKCQNLVEALDDALASPSGGFLSAADAAKATVAVMKAEPDDLAS